VLELRPHFGRTMPTAFIRIEGRALVWSQQPMHLPEQSTATVRTNRTLYRVVRRFDIPLLYLCDTPGIMVGPEIEKTALVRHSSRMSRSRR
jgi:acetyl-CoA carboxylase carboxyltransferase component